MIDPTTQSETLTDPAQRAASTFPHHSQRQIATNSRPSSLPPRKIFQIRYDLSRIPDIKTEQDAEMEQEAQTADPITRLIFKNITSSSGECLDLCKSSPYFSRIDVADQQVLFEKAAYELIIVCIWYFSLDIDYDPRLYKTTFLF